MTRQMIDLHSHTTASDGEHAPEALLALARAAGVRTLAVTDHDTVAGLERARTAAAAEGVELVDGIEISAFEGGREVHILGHFVEPQEPRLTAYATGVRTERTDRMERMVDRMRALGFPISMGEVQRLAAGAQLGRPHLALALLERGFVTSTKEAFDRFLGDGKPGWVDRFRLPAQEAIALVHGAGGTATLAHPAVSRVSPLALRALAAGGLDGLEVFHADHVPSQRDSLLREAAALSLVPTAGSDYHGPRVSPDRAFGDVAMPPEHFEALRARAQAHRLRRPL